MVEAVIVERIKIKSPPLYKRGGGVGNELSCPPMLYLDS